MKIIIDYLEDVSRKIVAEADAQGRNKSGKIGDSLEVKVDGNSHKLLGFRWIVEAWESGRGETVNSGDGAVRRAITKWVADNNITPRDNISTKSLIYLITRKIHEEGTALKIAGGHSGVLTKAITESSLESLANKIAISYESDILKIL